MCASISMSATVGASRARSSLRNASSAAGSWIAPPGRLSAEKPLSGSANAVGPVAALSRAATTAATLRMPAASMRTWVNVGLCA